MSKHEGETLDPGPCAHCGEPAICFGVYEDSTQPAARACDSCCGHGNEDGWCKPIASCETCGDWLTQPGTCPCELSPAVQA